MAIRLYGDTAPKTTLKAAPIRLYSDTPKPATTQTSASTQAQTPAPKFTPFVGSGYGVSQSTDPYSGRPLVTVPYTVSPTFTTPATTISVQDKNRVASLFDPTKAQPITRDMLANGRLPESASQAVRTALGAGYNEQLDHQIALTLSGANTPENLKLIPTAKNQKAGNLETKLANDVIAGRISLLDAQLQDAKQKGIKLPESAPSLIEKVRNSALKNVNPQAFEGIASLQTDPLGLKNTNIVDAPKKIVDTVVNSVSQAGDSLFNFLYKLTSNAPASQKVGAGLQSAAATGGALFSPISGLFAGAEQIPVLKSVSTLVSLPFQIAGEGGKLVVDRMLSHGILSSLPEQTKADIKQGAEEVGALVGQIILGKVSILDRILPKDKVAEQVRVDVKTTNPELAKQVDSIQPRTLEKIVADHGTEGAKVIVKQAADTASRIQSGEITKENIQPVLDAAVKPAEASTPETGKVRLYNEPAKPTESIKPSAPTSPLLAEARKYKTLEEFAQSLGLKDANELGFKNIYRKYQGTYSNSYFDFPKLSEHPAGAKLPDTLTVYRGITSNAPSDAKIGLHWTTDKTYAQTYGDKIQTITAPKSDFRINPHVPGAKDFVYLPKGTPKSKVVFDSQLPSLTSLWNEAQRGGEITTPKLTPELSNVLDELQSSQAGRRTTAIAPTGERTPIAEPSTFPEWVPSRLRSKDLFNQVIDLYKGGKEPKPSTKVAELYDLVDARVMKERGSGEINAESVFGPAEIPKAPIEPINLRGGGTTASALTGGIDKFVTEDVKPAVKGVIGGVAKTWDTIKKIFTPSLRGEEAKMTASVLRESLGRMARQKEVLFETLSKARKELDKYTPEQSLKLIDSIEKGQPTPGFEQFTSVVREALDIRWKKIQAIKGTDAYIENYFPHIWKDPVKAGAELLRAFGKRPFEGTKDYLKQRTIPTIADGVNLGLVPESYNPVDLVLARVVDMDRFLMANDVWTSLKDQGLRKFVGMGEKAPEGWAQVNDKISRSFQFSPTEKGMILRGNWYLPEQAATILNNYLSPGLRGNPIYNAFRLVSNDLNQVQLGVSGFHALFTSADAVISKAALELQKTTEGSVVSAGKVITAPIVAPYYLFENLVRGNKLLKDYFKENPEMPAMVDALERAGGRVRMDSFYLNNAAGNFMKALRGGNILGAAFRAPGAILEVAAKPIMQWLVPRQKLGVFADGATHIMEKAKTEGWSEPKTTLRLQEMWDSVDNRMGQLVYDNLFWNKVIKDLGMASTRSLGWNLGTIRELGGGAMQLLSTPAKAVGKLTGLYKGEIRMTPKMAYTLTLPYVAGAWGAIIYYLYNGTAPKTLKDYYYPTTGNTKPDGTEERISLPTYMKDVFAYGIEGPQTLLNKVHPEIATIIDMLQNKDYYGTEIRNSNDSTVAQVGQLLDYQASQFVPFSLTNLMKRAQVEGGSWQLYLQSFLGITPAPAYITRTPIQNDIYSAYDRRFGGGTKTGDQSKAQQQKAAIRTQYMLGNTDKANELLNQAVKDGVVKENGVRQFVAEADIPNDVKLFKQLPSSDQTVLLKKMELYQLQRYAWYAQKDVRASLSMLSDTAQTFVKMANDGEIKEPTWEKGQIQQ